MTNLSKLRGRKKDEFTQLKEFIDEKTWIDAQKLQNHIYVCGTSIYFFPNHTFFDKNLRKITKDLIKKHIEAFNSRTFHDFNQKRVFWIFENESKNCQCKKFWKNGRCKHMLAVQIHLKQITVKLSFLI